MAWAGTRSNAPMSMSLVWTDGVTDDGGVDI
jgi:hypothetical protein